MTYYFAEFSNNLPVYQSLNDVVSLDTTKFVSGTCVIVPGQGFFNWYINESDVRSDLTSNFVYPAVSGYGWIQDFSGLLVGDNGRIDLSNLAFTGYAWIGPKATKVITGITPPQIQTISFPGVLPGDLIYISFTSAPQGVPILPLDIEVSVDQVQITWQGIPTGNLNFNLVVFPPDFSE